MAVHLVGGGRDGETDPVLSRGFLEEAAALARERERPGPARVALLIVGEGDGARDHADRLAGSLAAAGPVEVVPTLLDGGRPASLAAVHDVDGILVGGGRTPSYLASLRPLAAEIRRQVAAGTPYLGFSAGAAIAAEGALVGGWRLGDVAVCPSSAAEGLEEVTVEQGLGLLDVTVEVHAVQWGTLARLIAAVDAGLVDGGVAVDEDTVLSVGEGSLRVSGAGTVWSVTRDDQGVRVIPVTG